MKTIAVIPARYASTRFPGKPLVNILGKSMIQRVYEQAKKAKTLDDVWVATDNQRIFDHVINFGGQVTMTSKQHQTGTDRCAEVYEQEQLDCEILLNIQGDEPFIQPEQIDLLVNFMQKNYAQYHVGTLIKKINSLQLLQNPNLIKVVFNKNNKALYFSRQAIPFQRNYPVENWVDNHQYYKHIGLYAFQAALLPELAKLPPSSLELAESLEQLRWMENGFDIGVVETHLETRSIDTKQDLEEAIKNRK